MQAGFSLAVQGRSFKYSRLSRTFSLLPRFSHARASEQTTGWVDRHARVEPVPRSVQETELLKHASATVLHLAGLWGGKRNPANWVQRVAPSKSALAMKVAGAPPS